jgi:hypothetical protein
VPVTTRYRLRTLTPAAAVALVLMVLSAVACSGDKKAPTTTAPEGFTVANSAKEGFALAVPSEWTQIPLSFNPAVFDTTANSLRLANPKLASILNQARVLGQAGGKFMAVAKDGVANVNLTVDKPKEKTVEQIVTASIEALKNIQATNFNQEPATLNGKPAVKLTFRLPVETDNGTVPTDEVQHYLLDHKKAYILTVAGAPGDVAGAIASSVRLR